LMISCASDKSRRLLMYRVEIRSRAEKDIDALPSALSRRILDSIANLAAEPRPIGVQKLAAAGGYRVRVGDYRIVYEMSMTPTRSRLRASAIDAMYIAAYSATSLQP
jgi:mRNA interferase RelE/StbE